MKAFISYSHIDERYVKRLHTHLSQLKREGLISTWYDREIAAGSILDDVIGTNLESSDLFIAITSPDFLNSTYCYEKEMNRAIEKHSSNEIHIVPIIVEPCDWLNSPLSQFRATPIDGKPISTLSNQNTAFLDVINDLRNLVTSAVQKSVAVSARKKAAPVTKSKISNLRIKRDFDKIEKIKFKKSAFVEIADNLEKWCNEVNSVEGISALYETQNDARFFITLVNKNKSNAVAERTVYVSEGSYMGSQISILNNRSDSTSSSNGGYAVDADDYQLFLTNHFSMTSSREKKMTPLDAANEIWGEMMKSIGIEYANE